MSSLFSLMSDWFNEVWYKLLSGIGVLILECLIVVYLVDCYQEYKATISSHINLFYKYLLTLSSLLFLPVGLVCLISCVIPDHVVISLSLPHHFLGTTNISCFEDHHFLTAGDIWNYKVYMALMGYFNFLAYGFLMSSVVLPEYFNIQKNSPKQLVICAVTTTIYFFVSCGLVVFYVWLDWIDDSINNSPSDWKHFGNDTTIVWTNKDQITSESCKNGRKEERNVFLMVIGVLYLMCLLCWVIMCNIRAFLPLPTQPVEVENPQVILEDNDEEQPQDLLQNEQEIENE